VEGDLEVERSSEEFRLARQKSALRLMGTIFCVLRPKLVTDLFILGWIYHVMRGSTYGEKNPTAAAVKRLNISNYEISENLEIPEDIYHVVSATMDQENGIFFLGVSSSFPGRIVQISLVNPDFT
jgi:hypothetical protein